jgi:NitT/TauT family transport system substrate-binding protein
MKLDPANDNSRRRPPGATECTPWVVHAFADIAPAAPLKYRATRAISAERREARENVDRTRRRDVSSAAGIPTPGNVVTHDIRRADLHLTPRSASRLRDLFLIHDSRLNVLPGVLHISESAAAEPLFKMPLQRTRAIEFNVTLGQGNPVCQITYPYFGQRSEVGRDVEIDLEPRIDRTNVHLGRCTDQPPVASARGDAREYELNRSAPGWEVFRMYLAMYVPHQQAHIQFVVAELGAVPSLTPLAQQVDDWRKLPALLGEMIFRALAASFPCHDANVFKLLQHSVAGLVVPLGAMAPGFWRPGQSSLPDTIANPPICRVAGDVEAIAPGSVPRELKITWNTNAVCNVGVAVADERGFFAKRNLKVEKINFAGATDQLLELLASGKADAGVGMALAWMKPLEQGFDVKLTAAIHGGCIRLITTRESGITGVAALKGKTVGTNSMASPDKNFISILAIKQGIDPVKDIEWRAYPADLLGVALQKGEIQAFSGPDPIVSILRDRDHLVEVTNNLAGEFAQRACCVLGIRGRLVRDERPVAAAVTAALMDAQEWVAENPDAAAAIFAGFTKVATAEQLAPMLRGHTHHHHPVDGDLKQEVALYAQELKQASVFKSSTDPAQFAERVCADVLAT